ncbi:MAG: radical SAM protein [Candidatus Omnitrophota bacterium]|jgi:MoaA/NifB/PqqE/SkfB family radical SAM enzyme
MKKSYLNKNRPQPYFDMIKDYFKEEIPWLYILLKKCFYYLKYTIFTPPLDAVEIEINSFCNRKCRYCPNYDHTRERIFLEGNLFYKIINDLKKMKFKGAITFNMYNEPLLDTRLSGFIEYVRKELPSAYIYLNTNGDLLNLHLWRKLRASGLDFANVTQYDEKINDNIQHLLDELDLEEKKHIRAYLLHNVINRAGLVDNNSNVKLPLEKYCSRPFYQLSINYKGKAVLCCNDYFGLVEIADVRNSSILTIWKNKIFKYYRKKLIFANRSGLKLCDKCDMFQ